MYVLNGKALFFNTVALILINYDDDDDDDDDDYYYNNNNNNKEARDYTVEPASANGENYPQ